MRDMYLHTNIFEYTPYPALTCQHYFTPICKSQCAVVLTLSLHLSLSFVASATASNRQQLRHCLLFCAFFCSFFCGLVTWAFVCRHLLPTLFRYHLWWQHPRSPALFSSIVCCVPQIDVATVSWGCVVTLGLAPCGVFLVEHAY